MNDSPELTNARLVANLEYLGLSRSQALLDGMIEDAVKQSLGYRDFLDRLLAEEVGAWRERRSAGRIKFAHFPAVKTIDQFDFTFQPSVDRKRIQELLTLRFIAHGENVVILGPPGVGKTHLAIGIGVAACQQGASVYFTTAEEMLTDLRWGFTENRLRERLRSYQRPQLLIIDELGYLPLDRTGANLFFQLIARRYEHGALILTSNRSEGEWGEVRGDTVIAAAVLDRLLHRSVTINIKGESYRLKDKRKAGVWTRPSGEAAQPGGDA